MTWRWGQLHLPADDTQDTVAVELAHWLAQFMMQHHQDSVTAPDGTVYDIELNVRLVAPQAGA